MIVAGPHTRQMLNYTLRNALGMVKYDVGFGTRLISIPASPETFLSTVPAILSLSRNIPGDMRIEANDARKFLEALAG